MVVNRLPARLWITFVLAVLFLGKPAWGSSGNALPRPTSEALGMADANVALAAGPAAQFVNPANILDSGTESRWEAGALLGGVFPTFTRDAAAGAAATGEHAAKTTYPMVPYAAMTFPLSDRVAVGFAADSPYGLRSEWKDHQFDLNLGLLGTADLAQAAELKTVRLGPAAALRLDDAWSLGARGFVQYAEALEENDIYSVKGDGTSFGGQIGIRYQAENTKFGAAYSSRTNTEIKGTLGGIHSVASASLIAGDARAKILLPDRLQTGVAFRLRPELWWEIDLDWIGWAYVDELSIYQANGTLANAGKNARHNKDTLSVRTGMQWKRSPRLTLYAGVGYDPTPVPERDVAPTQGMLRKTRIAFGGAYATESGLKLGVTYQYVRGHPRRVGATDQDSFGGSDTHLYEGTYESESHILGIGLAGEF